MGLEKQDKNPKARGTNDDHKQQEALSKKSLRQGKYMQEDFRGTHPKTRAKSTLSDSFGRDWGRPTQVKQDSRPEQNPPQEKPKRRKKVSKLGTPRNYKVAGLKGRDCKRQAKYSREHAIRPNPRRRP